MTRRRNHLSLNIISIIVNPEILKDYIGFHEFLDCFETDDNINKITTAWGVKCLRFKFNFHQGKGKKFVDVAGPDGDIWFSYFQS